MSTPIGRAVAGLLSVFAVFERELLKERVRAGIAHARKRGQRHGRPPTVTKYGAKVVRLYNQGLPKAEIARRLRISRASVRRLLSPK